MRWWHRWRGHRVRWVPGLPGYRCNCVLRVEGGGMTTHRVVCPCGYDVPVDGWLDAIEVSRLHSRAPGCDAVVDLHYSKETA